MLNENALIAIAEKINDVIEFIDKYINEVKKEAAAPVAETTESDIIFNNLLMLVDMFFSSEENKEKYLKYLKEHRHNANDIEWTDEDTRIYGNVLSSLKYAYEDLMDKKSVDTAKDVHEAFDWMGNLKDKMFALARKEVTYDVEHCSRRGRMGGVPQEFSEKAEEYQKALKPPYDADDIISAYESGMMEEEKEVDKAYKRRDDVVFRKGLSEGRKEALEGLPKWRYAEHELRSSVIEYLVEYRDDSGDRPIYTVIPTNYVEEEQRYLEINDLLLSLGTKTE